MFPRLASAAAALLALLALPAAITPALAADVTGRASVIDGDTLVADGTNDAPGSDGYQIGGECVEFCISGECWFPKVQLWACGKTDPLHGKNGNQKWKLVPVEGGTQIVNTRANQCLTATEQPGC